jgi:hypothetical protein
MSRHVILYWNCCHVMLYWNSCHVILYWNCYYVVLYWNCLHFKHEKWWIQGLINPWNMIYASVNIVFHGLINPCIHLMESHQLYNVCFQTLLFYCVNVAQVIPHLAAILLFVQFELIPNNADFVPQKPLSAQRLPLLT